MRDNGYKNAAYAIAELMDNAIQAGASQLELDTGIVSASDPRERWWGVEVEFSPSLFNCPS